jgi:hypothetical protein
MREPVCGNFGSESECCNVVGSGGMYDGGAGRRGLRGDVVGVEVEGVEAEHLREDCLRGEVDVGTCEPYRSSEGLGDVGGFVW